MHGGGTPSKEDPDAELEKGVGSITVPWGFLVRRFFFLTCPHTREEEDLN
jgi:hypothetical protein